MPSAADAAEIQALLSGLEAAARADILAWWRDYGGSDPDALRRLLEQWYPNLIDPYMAASATITAQWYADLDPASNFPVETAAPAPREALQASARWAITQPNPPDALSGSATRRIFDASRDTVRDNVIREGVTYARYASATACPWCRVLATREAVYKTAETAVKGHDNCVPAGTLVSGPPVEAAYRRFYEGEVVVIDTASGQKLTITPNHPVLTDQGWIPASFLQRGDNVVRSTRSDAGASAIPDKHQQPALIENVWGSFAVNGLIRVPVAAEDFHGDGVNGEVEIVGSNRHLNTWPHAAFHQEMMERPFTISGWRDPRHRFPCFGNSAPFLPRPLSASRRVMAGSSEFGPLFRSQSRHSNPVGVGVASRRDPQLHQTAAYYDSTGVQLSGDFKFRQLLVDIESPNQVSRDVDTIGARFDPAGFEFTAENRFAYTKLGLNLLATLSGKVRPDRIVECRRISFSGDVYNLQTENGWYSADALIVSNCHCMAVPVRSGDTWQRPDYIDAWSDEYNQARAEVGGNLDDIANYLRRKTSPQGD